MPIMDWTEYADHAVVHICRSLTIDALGLVMHVAVMPHLFPIPEQFTKESVIEAWPWAFGHVLYARFTVAEDAQ